MARIILPEWRNNNEHVNYPFRDDMPLINAAGVPLDRDLFYDARIYPIGASVRFFLKSINITSGVVSLVIGDEELNDVATGAFTIGAEPDTIALFDEYLRPAGILVSSSQKLALLSGVYGQGTTEFAIDETEFVPTVCIPTPQYGVRGFLLDDGTVLTGDAYLVGTDGIVLSTEDGAIRIDAVGDPYALAKNCEEEGTPIEPFCGVRTINQIPPDENGDFKLTVGSNVSADNVLRISVDPGGYIKIRAVGQIGAK